MAGKKLDSAYAVEQDGKVILVDPTWVVDGPNTRIEKEHDQKKKDLALAWDIYKSGQGTPCNGYQIGEKLYIADGLTRKRAISLIRGGFTGPDGETHQDPNRKLKVVINPEIIDDKSAFMASVRGNVRNDVSPVNIALSVKKLIEEFGLTKTEVAALYGYNNTNAVSRYQKVTALPSQVQDAIHDGKISVDAALEIGKMPEADQQQAVQDAKAGAKVTSAAIQDKKAKAQEAAGAEVTVKPRNTAALVRFIDEQVFAEDSEASATAKDLFAALKKWLAGKSGDKALWNKIETVK